MAILVPDDPRLGANPGANFDSPFPSNDSNLSGQFGTLLDAVATLPGADPDGATAALSAKAWTRAQARVMFDRTTSPIAGGIPSDVLKKVANIAQNGRVQGIFSNITFSSTTSSSKMENTIGKVALDVALTALTAVPVYGQILEAAVGIGRFIAGLFKKDKEKVVLYVPWQEYSRNVDEDVVNNIVAPVMGNVDWTMLFTPALDWQHGFSLEQTEKKGETRAYGVFSDATGEPVEYPGIGMMPGTERLTQSIQVATVHRGPTSRMDAVTDVGSFWQSTSQFLTGAYGMVGKRGNPDMYKVQASALRDMWRGYFESFFGDAWDRWGGMDEANRTFLAKCLAPFIYIRGEEDPDDPDFYSRANFESFGMPYINPDLFTNAFEDSYNNCYSHIEKLYIRPALTALMQRQRSALSYSLACALVRPKDVQDLPRFAAFTDPGPALSGKYDTFGEELTALCLDMREELLRHEARYDLAKLRPDTPMFQYWAPDVRDVDPKFAEKLEATFGSALSFKARGPRKIVIAQAVPEGPPQGKPGGGPPFPLPPGQPIQQKYVYPILAALGVGVGAGAAIWLGEGY